MTQSITILGATGSIGRSTLDVVSRYPERFSVHAVAGGSRVEPLVDVCLSARPKRAVIADASKVVELEQALCTVGLGDIEVLGGPRPSPASRMIPIRTSSCRPWSAPRALRPPLRPLARASAFFLPTRRASSAAAVF